jgi:hypothetical protein
MMLESIRLEDVAFVERCSLAPHGDILQFSVNKVDGVGIRTFISTVTGGAEALMFIGGADHGHVVALESIGNPAALNITQLVRIVAHEPYPFMDRVENIPTGALLYQPETGAFLARGKVIHNNSPLQMSVFVYLTPEGEKFPIGHAIETINPTRWKGVARSFGLEALELALP